MGLQFARIDRAASVRPDTDCALGIHINEGFGPSNSTLIRIPEQRGVWSAIAASSLSIERLKL